MGNGEGRREFKWQVQQYERTRHDQKRVYIKLATDNEWEARQEFLLQIVKAIKSQQATELRLVEREYTGVLFVRADASIDTRPWCPDGETMSDKYYGYAKQF